MTTPTLPAGLYSSPPSRALATFTTTCVPGEITKSGWSLRRECWGSYIGDSPEGVESGDRLLTIYCLATRTKAVLEIHHSTMEAGP